MKSIRPEIAAYYFPSYHKDPRNDSIHFPGWNEWEVLKNARSRFPGHDQPKIPLWGYEDEADPSVMTHKINAAADHGIDGFMFDWYWYENKPFMERALTEGFQKAENNSRLKYALMWANHDWHNIHPIGRDHIFPLIFSGAVSETEFDRMTDYIIEKHFRHPSYWKIDGAPWFVIYWIGNFAEQIGGWETAARALARFREKTKKAGFPDLHLTLILWGSQVLPGEKALSAPEDVIRTVGAQSVTSYVWTHHLTLPDFPLTEFEVPFEVNVRYWHEARERFPVPYFPNVTMGWDSSPRTFQDEPYKNYGYPYCPVMKTTPEQFETALRRVRDFCAEKPEDHRIVTINAWNEWTEGSYLEPDTIRKYGYLEAIRRVFGPAVSN